jgi:hypothetical protein
MVHVKAVPLPDNWWAIDCDECGVLVTVKDTQLPDEIPPIVGKYCTRHLYEHGVTIPEAFRRFLDA